MMKSVEPSRLKEINEIDDIEDVDYSFYATKSMNYSWVNADEKSDNGYKHHKDLGYQIKKNSIKKLDYYSNTNTVGNLPQEVEATLPNYRYIVKLVIGII